MESAYDRKFADMRKYIPFLDGMIKRLESSTSTSPRAAQLSKIKALRDLLTDKNKRMKMENLVKCEQVLVNLYAKVEQSEILPTSKGCDKIGLKTEAYCEPQKNSSYIDLESVRQKLKTVSMQNMILSSEKREEESHKPTFEIAQPQSQPSCSVINRESALFQRRPVVDPISNNDKHAANQPPRRNYTRVLVSPEPSVRRWTANEVSPVHSDKFLYQRRSPRKPQKSPHKKDRKKHKRDLERSSKKKHSRISDNFNITLNVPEESLSSLNTTNIFDRIVTCDDTDVDIEQLRSLRTQIVKELKQTGANEDITDYILNSYRKKKKKSKKTEVEEGEIEDSDNEAMENIYGNLIIELKNESAGSARMNESDNLHNKINNEKDDGHKIKISLVISNPEKDVQSASDRKNYQGELKSSETTLDEEANRLSDISKEKIKEVQLASSNECHRESIIPQSISSIAQRINDPAELIVLKNTEADISPRRDGIETNIVNMSHQKVNNECDTDKVAARPNEIPSFKKTQYEQNQNTISEQVSLGDQHSTQRTIDSRVDLKDTDNASQESNSCSEEIPFLSKSSDKGNSTQESKISEIDILTALKREILSEAIDIPASKSDTPPLHQPKITKVTDKAILVTEKKRRISLEKYKEKSSSLRIPLFLNDTKNSLLEKNKSRALTAKEYERFQVILKSTLEDSSDEEIKEPSETSIDDIYKDLAPKSPDENQSFSSTLNNPIIIPSDPIKNTSDQCDVDMRASSQTLPERITSVEPVTVSISSHKIVGNQQASGNNAMNFYNSIDQVKLVNSEKTMLKDPRYESKGMSPCIKPNSVCETLSNTTGDVVSSINNQRTCMLTPSYPNMTPKNYEMTPSRQYDYDEMSSNRKHVYAPMCFSDSRTIWETRDNSINGTKSDGNSWGNHNNKSSSTVRDNGKDRVNWQKNDSRTSSHIEEPWNNRDVRSNSTVRDMMSPRVWEERDSRSGPGCREDSSRLLDPRHSNNDKQPQRARIDRDPRLKADRRDDRSNMDYATGSGVYSGRTSNHAFGRTEYPSTPSHSFGRSEHPSTPVHPFGRGVESSMPHSHSVGRADYQSTPIHFLGRSECPTTPSHPFGRTDCPPTPIHPFGRSECPPTPSHPFGRSECPPTPSHPFGRSECPLTPSHPFGRADGSSTPSYSYGRTECPCATGHPFGRIVPGCHRCYPEHHGNMNVSIKEHTMNRAEINRNIIPESLNSRDTHLGQRESSLSESRPLLRELSVGRENRALLREPSIGRGENRTLLREPSVGRGEYRTMLTEPSVGRAVREPSISRSLNFEHGNLNSVKKDLLKSQKNINRNFSKNHTLSVESIAGRPFTIDTRVNSTFQSSLLESSASNGLVQTFNDRRKRASSVGRFLTRECNHRSPVRDTSTLKVLTRDTESFRRARSVGRDLLPNREIYSNSFHHSYREKSIDRNDWRSDYLFDRKEKKGNERRSDLREKSITRELVNKRDPRITRITSSRHPKDQIENETHSRNDRNFRNSSNRYHGRDPRLIYNEGNRSSERRRSDRHNNYKSSDKYCGIAYTSDNIAKGNVLGPGYGVKNYRIPKIKRTIDDLNKLLVDTEENLSDDSNKYTKEPSNENRKLNTKRQNNKKEDSHSERSKLPEKIPSKASYSKDNKEISKQKEDTNSNKRHSQRRRGRSAKSHRAIYDSDTDSNDKISEASSETNTNKMDNKTEQKRDIDEEYCKTAKVNDVLINQQDDNNDINTKIDELIAVLDKDLSPNKNDIPRNDIHKIDRDDGVDNTANDDISLKKITEISEASEMNLNEEGNCVTNISTNSVKEMEVDPLLHEIYTDSSKNTVNVEIRNNVPVSANDNSASSLECKKQLNMALKENLVTNNQYLVRTDHQNSFDNNNLNVDRNNEQTDVKKASIKPDISNNSIFEVNIDSVLENLENENSKLPISKDISSSKETKTVDKDAPKKLVSDGNESQESRFVCIPVSTHKSSNANDVAASASNYENDTKTFNTFITPDSTIDQDTKTDEKSCDVDLPDSTNDVADENDGTIENNDQTNSVINNDTGSCSNQDSNETSKEIYPMESILTILQDKSRIKEFLSKLDDRSNETEKLRRKLERLTEIESDEENTEKLHNKEALQKTRPVVAKAVKQAKKRKMGRFSKKKKTVTVKQTVVGKAEEKRMTRSEAVAQQVEKENKVKKGRNRELQLLQNDLREMFISDDVLNVTGIRMCRLAKFIDEDKQANINKKNETVVQKTNKAKINKKTGTVEENTIEETYFCSPKVVLEKVIDTSDKIKNIISNVSHMEESDEIVKPARKKPGPKPKIHLETSKSTVQESVARKIFSKYKAGPKSKTKNLKNKGIYDVYEFEDSPTYTDCTFSENSPENMFSESEDESLNSLKGIENDETKIKPKRKKSSWKMGIIKSKTKKKKSVDSKQSFHNIIETSPIASKIPDYNCFTDKNYCFTNSNIKYSCKLCTFEGIKIVHHYKETHPHYEVPLSRINPTAAEEAIKQSLVTDFQVLNKLAITKSICRFCFTVLDKRCNLESFFWHVVSTHTGEYKHTCNECINESKCPMTLDIPSPPKDTQGLLLGYICGECNYTQISLENLKMHVAVRHDNEQTEVYTINLSEMDCTLETRSIPRTRNQISKLESTSGVVKRSLRSSQKLTELNDARSDITGSSDHLSEDEVSPQPARSSKNKLASQKIFENDDFSDESNQTKQTCNISDTSIKIENDYAEQDECSNFDDISLTNSLEVDSRGKQQSLLSLSHENIASQYPPFRVSYTQTGGKEYICCINKNHIYKTTLLISFKKHVQNKHKSDLWNGYCFICNTVVQEKEGTTYYTCLLHFLEYHMDSFPVLESMSAETDVSMTINIAPETSVDQNISITETMIPIASPKSYINVRPLSELLQKLSPVVSPEASTAPTNVAQLITGDVMPICFDQPNTSDADMGLRIENVVSLNPSEELMSMSEIERFPTDTQFVPFKDNKEIVPPPEEVLRAVASQKHILVLDTMLTREKLAQTFKCAGRFCSFTSDTPEPAVIHATFHQRLGGVGAFLCVYCHFDARDSAIDLVSHVFREHGHCMFACSYCFYRASAGSLIEAHVRRVHSAKPLDNGILQVSTGTHDGTNAAAGLLARTDAVSLYICTQVETEKPNSERCKFRSYISSKFIVHLQQRHSTCSTIDCNLCDNKFPDGVELVKHLRSHGLCLYQCTWCVKGLDSEVELLEHSSEMHPMRRPQAYVRTIIENKDKDSGSKYKMLPLVHINKQCVTPILITSNTSSENPVKEAERAIELEKLIGQTAPSVDNTSLQPLAMVSDQSSNLGTVLASIVENKSQEKKQAVTESILPNSILENTLQKTVKPEPQTSNDNEKITSNKTSCEEVGNIINLDSDDEDSKVNLIIDKESFSDVIDLLDDNDSNVTEMTDIQTENTNTPSVRYPDNVLFKCANCKNTYKTVTFFRRHLYACYPGTNAKLDCAHCNFITACLKDLCRHYIQHHARLKIYVCSTCKYESGNRQEVVKHIYIVHNSSKITNVKITDMDDKILHLIGPDSSKPCPKRKKSTGEAGTKNKKYGPEEINSLPINSIFDEHIFCSKCEYGTKVRTNMIRHLVGHASQMPVSHTGPINPVPHLESNEKHFDKMTNLAASSNLTRAPEVQQRESSSPVVAFRIAPETAARYPQYVTERKRHACGAKGCSYISLDEAMLKCHWETLHSGSNEYRCVHCPPTQQLDTSRPLTAARIIAHLKMHDAKLYACSQCSYYHHQSHLVEKHALDKHGPTPCRVITLREPVAPGPAADQRPNTGPTMDLKAWQCGLCIFKSMLRPEVAEHCARIHHSKFQFKCAFCPYKSSTIDSVTKHHGTSHQDSNAQVFHYYYREGSLPDEADGTPRWIKQKLQCSNSNIESDIKSENDAQEPSTKLTVPSVPDAASVDLNIVKNEVVDETVLETRLEDLIKNFGEFCEPKGKKYVCPLCKMASEENRETMAAHLFEELNYRKWICSICSYKAFHKIGLMEHTLQEHRQTREPGELPANAKIETWVYKLLEHQSAIMGVTDNQAKVPLAENNKVDLPEPPKNKLESSEEFILSNDAVSLPVRKTPELPSDAGDNAKPSMKELEHLFGQFGASYNMCFSCPKCDFKIKEESKMSEHLEMELAKVRWACSTCLEKFSSYHEAQLHCRTGHIGQSTRVVEVSRDPNLRCAWISAVIQVQKLTMNYMPLRACISDNQPTLLADNSTLAKLTDLPTNSESSDNSLLVVRYEKSISPPEEQPVRRKRPAYLAELESDEERLVIDELPQKTTTGPQHQCPHCSYSTKYKNSLTDHVIKHFNLKPYKCYYCDYSNYKGMVYKHQASMHSGLIRQLVKVSIPDGQPLVKKLFRSRQRNKQKTKSKVDETVCLLCQKVVNSVGADHSHLGEQNQIAKIGEVILKCSICSALRKGTEDMLLHGKKSHSGIVKSEPTKLELKLLLKSLQENEVLDIIDLDEDNDDEVQGVKRKRSDEELTPEPKSKRVAKKSTTKLPIKNAVARKSTTKLPIIIHDSEDSEDEEYSFYGSEPADLNKLAYLKTYMPFCGTLTQFNVKHLNRIINLTPKVFLKDCKKVKK